MREYFLYILLLIIIIIAAVDSWGETSKTIMYGVAIVSILGLVFIKLKENKKNKS